MNIVNSKWIETLNYICNYRIHSKYSIMTLKIAIIKERKNPPDRRVVFSPEMCVKALQKFPEIQFNVESSDIRIFSDEDYREKGIEVVDDVSDCDVFLGVKEVPIDALIPNKKYFFFSHTIKEQPYNKKLLQAILEKNIALYDHETIVYENGSRVIGFGRYAGIVGAYNGFRALGLRDKLFSLPKVEHLPDYDAVKNELDKIQLPVIKIILTGNGKVAHGAREILDYLQIREVGVNDFLNQSYNEAVYCNIDVLDYNKRKDGQIVDKYDFYKYPENYVSDFMRFAKVSDVFITGHFYGNGAPLFFTKEEAKSVEFKINLIADISCDINIPIPSTIRASTIADPFYGYDPISESETLFDAKGAITVMAVDNLPCELPKDASEGFGKVFLEKVIPTFFNNDRDKILERALITKEGKLCSRFLYLKNYVS